LDILPTVLHYAGIDKAHLELDGHNLSAILEGGSQALNRPLFWHFPIYLEAYNQQDNENRDALFRTRPGTVVRFGDWKLHYYFEDNEVELYNLTADIGERNNLAEEAKDKTDELYHYLQDWWRETKAPIPTNLNPDYVE
jgi:arylsulfatase A-like enzyme